MVTTYPSCIRLCESGGEQKIENKTELFREYTRRVVCFPVPEFRLKYYRYPV